MHSFDGEKQHRWTALHVVPTHLGAIIDGLIVTAAMLAVNTKEYVISPIVGTRRCWWLTLSAASREIDCKPRIPLNERTQTGISKTICKRDTC